MHFISFFINLIIFIQADVGLALLVGHASTNTTEDISSPAGGQTTPGSAVPSNAAPASGDGSSSAVSAEDLLNARDKELQQRGAALNNARVAHMKVLSKANLTLIEYVIYTN